MEKLTPCLAPVPLAADTVQLTLHCRMTLSADLIDKRRKSKVDNNKNTKHKTQKTNKKTQKTQKARTHVHTYTRTHTHTHIHNYMIIMNT